MSDILSALSTTRDTAQAFREVSAQLHKEPSLVLFFTSTIHSFEQLTSYFNEKYSNCDVVGVTTTGEIGPQGFSQHSLSAQSYSKDFGQVQAVLMNNIEKYPIFDRTKVLQSAKKLGIRLESPQIDKEGLAFIFPTGLVAGEEKMLSIVNSIFHHDGFPIFGGTAGDDEKFEKTIVSLNGQQTGKGGVVVFIKPYLEFYIQKENIFKSTGIELKITKADPEKRIVYEINNESAARVYARALGVSEQQLPRYFMKNPLGRCFNEELLIASPFRVESNGAIAFYCQVYQDAVVELLEPRDPVETLQTTLATFTSKFNRLEGVLACNCILRKLQFQEERLFPALNSELSQLPNLAGFSSYGEQLNKSLINQTLLLIGFGK
ncbi:FIST signal transduction protein [Lysinibacillus parviboronicapiens]|uniref:FIST signal transduction protein n=1 Tax=Lysinibacillus parviboronicapiens TaxID=436516 RepID=UPI000D3A8965|nr:FIST N-terminal domain-containing protein [Lysinibacillus parviboronicapiens]